MQYQPGMLVRLKATGALFRVESVAKKRKLVVVDWPTRLTVDRDAVQVVKENNYFDRCPGKPPNDTCDQSDQAPG
jgi:hypothetical protein